MRYSNESKFDKKLKELSGYNESCFGYVTADGGKYDLYFENQLWHNFISEMSKDEKAYKAYALGSGSELKEKTTKNKKIIPPKMASIASSSRFIYCTFKNKDYYKKLSLIVDDIDDNGEFQFEDKLAIKNVKMAKANLDASYKTPNKHIYIEAKCHEMFATNELTFSKGYLKGKALCGDYKYSLNIDEKFIIINDDDVQISPRAFNLSEDEKLYICAKQFICHLLGVSHFNVSCKELIYLYFKPEKLSGYDKEYAILERQFDNFCKSKYISEFCLKNNISIKLVYSTNNSFESEFIPKIVKQYDYCK